MVTMKSHSARLQIEVSHELCIMYQLIGLFPSIFYPYRGMEWKFPGVCQKHCRKESKTEISKAVRGSFPKGSYQLRQALQGVIPRKLDS